MLFSLLFQTSKRVVTFFSQLCFISTNTPVVNHRLPRDDMFVLVATAEVQASWGGATAYVYRRNALPAPNAVNDPMAHLQEVLNRPIPI